MADVLTVDPSELSDAGISADAAELSPVGQTPLVERAKAVASNIWDTAKKSFTTPLAQALNDSLGKYGSVPGGHVPTLQEHYQNVRNWLAQHPDGVLSDIVSKVPGASFLTKLAADAGEAGAGAVDFLTSPAGAAAVATGGSSNPLVSGAARAMVAGVQAPGAISATAEAVRHPSEESVSHAIVADVSAFAPIGPEVGRGAVEGARTASSALEQHNIEAERLVEQERQQGTGQEAGEKILGGEIPVKVGDQELTIRSAGGSTQGRPFYQVVDKSGKPVFAGFGDNVQAYLRQAGARPPGEVAAAPPEARYPENQPTGPDLVQNAPNPRKLAAKPTVPESGEPENVARAQDARDRLSQQLTGKPFSDLSNPDRLVVDEFVSQGYGFSSAPSTATAPPAASNNRPIAVSPEDLSTPRTEASPPSPVSGTPQGTPAPAPSAQPLPVSAPAAAASAPSGTPGTSPSSAVPAVGIQGTARETSIAVPRETPQKQPTTGQPSVPPALGRQAVVAVPGEKTSYPVQYAVRELADVESSHNPQNFEPNPNYQLRNDRDYGQTENAARVAAAAQDFRPEFVLTDSPTAEHGPTIIDQNGNALGGNNRLMALKRVYASADPAQAEEYKTELAAKAQQFGIDPAAVQKFKQPVLVRQVTQPLTQPQAQNAITDFNKTSAASLAPAEQAVSDGRRLSAAALKMISGQIEDTGEEGTLAQALRGDDGANILAKLVKDGVITEQEKNGYLDERNFLTPEAKDRISKALVGRMYATPKEFTQTPPELRNKIERIAPQVLRVEDRQGWELTQPVKQAVDLLAKMRTAKVEDVDNLEKEGAFEQSHYPPDVKQIAKKLQEGQLSAQRAFRQYANDEAMSRPGAQTSLYEPPSQREAFDAAFGVSEKAKRTSAKETERGSFSNRPKQENQSLFGDQEAASEEAEHSAKSDEARLTKARLEAQLNAPIAREEQLKRLRRSKAQPQTSFFEETPEAPQRDLFSGQESLKPNVSVAEGERQAVILGLYEKGQPGVVLEHNPINSRSVAMVFRDQSGAPKAYLQFYLDDDLKHVAPPEHGLYPAVYVSPELRRTGIATKLYDAAADAGFDLSKVSGTEVTASGAAFLNARARSQPFGKERGAISSSLLTLGLDKFIAEDIAPTVQEAARTLAQASDEALKILLPTARGKNAKQAALIMSNRLAELARKSDQAEAALATAKRFFEKGGDAAGRQFILDYFGDEEAKLPQLGNRDLDGIATVLRAMLDSRRDEVQALGNGKLRGYYTNYFPRVWKDWRKAEQVFQSFFGRRPLEGGKSFLKQRKYPTIQDALDAGLEPVSWNPIDLVMLKVREMDRYVMAHQVLEDWKKSGLARFIDARTGKAPAGWQKVADPIGTVYGASVQNISEYPNAEVWKGLETVAQALGITHTRGFKSLNRGNAVGLASQGLKTVQTMHGSAEQVLAHEIGHQIDWLAGSGKRFTMEYPSKGAVDTIRDARKTLADSSASKDAKKQARETLKGMAPQIAQRKQFNNELRALADLRSGRPEYTHKREEKMALLAEMWVGAKEQFKKTAPLVYSEWATFLHSNPKLKALADIQGGTELTQIAQPYDVGGLVIKGHWWAPEGAARIMNNYLSPSLRTTSGAFKAVMGLNNVLNQFSMALSARHLAFTSVDAAVSKAALAIEAAVRGYPVEAVKHAAAVPLAPFTNMLQGNKLLKEWYKPGSQGGAMAKIADQLVAAGGRARMDEIYGTAIGDRMRHAFRNGNIWGAFFRAPFAAIEKISDVMMREIVPRQKLGVFADLAAFEMERLGPNATFEQTREAMSLAWKSVDNRMGQMVYDNLFWNRAAKDIAMLTVRSVGWNLGTIREIGGGAADLVKLPIQLAKGKPPAEVNLHRMVYIVALATVSAAIGAMYQYLRTGKGPTELKDYFFPKNGELDAQGRPQREAMPTYVKDVYHYTTEPGKTLANKVAPVWSLFAEMARNQDFYGTEIRHADDPWIKQMLQMAGHVIGAAEPFSIRNAQRAKETGQSPLEEGQRFFGIDAAPSGIEKTKAELLASELAQASVPAGGRTSQEAARKQAEQSISRMAQQKKDFGSLARDYATAGILSSKEIHEAAKRAQLPPLLRSAMGLPAPEFLQVWKAATQQERNELRPELAKKVRSAKELPDEERRIILPKLIQALQSVQ